MSFRPMSAFFILLFIKFENFKTQMHEKISTYLNRLVRSSHRFCPRTEHNSVVGL